MLNLKEIIRSKPGFACVGPVGSEKIKYAELQLGLKFSKEYIDYLSEFGAATYEGHELTGIIKEDRLNVVMVTLKEKGFNAVISGPFYVVEKTNIDGVVIWQAEDGQIFSSVPNQPLTKLCDSLAEYVTGSF